MLTFWCTGDDSYGEMICVGCVRKHFFLMAYKHVPLVHDRTKKEEQGGSSKTDPACKLKDCCDRSSDCQEDKPGQSTPKPEEKATTLFLPEGWRSELCQCLECLDRDENLKSHM